VSKKTLEQRLAEIFESELKRFLALPIKERINETKHFLRWNSKELYTIFEKYSEFIEEDTKELNQTEKEGYFERSDEQLKYYLNREYQDILHALPHILWASHLIFDNTHSQLTYEAKEELRDFSNLNTPKKRINAYTDFFTQFIYEEVIEGGSQSNWNKWTRLYFLSLYERFSVVIEKSRNDIKKLKKQKMPIMEIRKEILEKYCIPEDYWNDVLKSKQIRKDKLARNWASQKMQKDFKKYVSKMGFADTYLIKVLRLARKDAESFLSCCRDYSNHKLFFLKWGDPNFPQLIHKLKVEGLSEIKFDSYVEETQPNMELYFT
jgi:hypothetical protein